MAGEFSPVSLSHKPNPGGHMCAGCALARSAESHPRYCLTKPPDKKYLHVNLAIDDATRKKAAIISRALHRPKYGDMKVLDVYPGTGQVTRALLEHDTKTYPHAWQVVITAVHKSPVQRDKYDALVPRGFCNVASSSMVDVNRTMRGVLGERFDNILVVKSYSVPPDMLRRGLLPLAYRLPRGGTILFQFMPVEGKTPQRIQFDTGDSLHWYPPEFLDEQIGAFSKNTRMTFRRSFEPLPETSFRHPFSGKVFAQGIPSLAVIKKCKLMYYLIVVI